MLLQNSFDEFFSDHAEVIKCKHFSLQAQPGQNNRHLRLVVFKVILDLYMPRNRSAF